MVRVFSFFTLIILTTCKINPYKEGQKVYTAYCNNCHMEDGKGLAKLVPPIATADYYLENYDKVACIIKYGIKDTILVNGVRYDQPMIGYPDISAIQVANLINYINNKWYKGTSIVTAQDIENQWSSCKNQVNE